MSFVKHFFSPRIQLQTGLGAEEQASAISACERFGLYRWCFFGSPPACLSTAVYEFWIPIKCNQAHGSGVGQVPVTSAALFHVTSCCQEVSDDGAGAPKGAPNSGGFMFAFGFDHSGRCPPR